MANSTKERACPAVGHDIAARECEENRISRYACPAACPHNSFAPANYLSYLTLEERTDAKAYDWLLKQSSIKEQVHAYLQKRPTTDFHARINWYLLNQPDATGLTSAQQWERAGFPGLNHDERILFRAKMKSRLMLIEVHRIFDDQRVEVVDLFAPADAPMLIMDRQLAATAARFAPYLGWVYPLPHYWRFNGAALLIPGLGQKEALETVTELFRHLGAPESVAERSRWLGEHHQRFTQAMLATSQARQRRLFAALDAQYGVVLYQLQAPLSQCRETLDAVEEVEPETPSDKEIGEGFSESRIWFDDPNPIIDLPEESRLVLGRVLIGQVYWRLEAMGAARLKKLRERFEACMGTRVRFTGERRDDIAKQFLAKEPPYDASLVPPPLLEGADQLLLFSSVIPNPTGSISKAEVNDSLWRAQDRGFIDSKLPALGGRSPREAAQDPALRPELIRLLKSRVRAHDEQNLRTGGTQDINGLLRELGANEILFDPPPVRPPLEEDENEEEEDGLFETEAHSYDPKRVPPPPLPTQPLTIEEATERVQAAMDTFDTAQDALDEMESSGSFLMLDMREFTEHLLSERHFDELATFLLQAWFALVPPGSMAPTIPTEKLFGRINRALDQLLQGLEQPQPDIFNLLFRSSRQPHLLQLIAAQMMETLGKEAGPHKLDSNLLAIQIVVLRVFIDTVHLALRATNRPKV